MLAWSRKVLRNERYPLVRSVHHQKSTKWTPPTVLYLSEPHPNEKVWRKIQRHRSMGSFRHGKGHYIQIPTDQQNIEQRNTCGNAFGIPVRFQHVLQDRQEACQKNSGALQTSTIEFPQCQKKKGTEGDVRHGHVHGWTEHGWSSKSGDPHEPQNITANEAQKNTFGRRRRRPIKSLRGTKMATRQSTHGSSARLVCWKSGRRRLPITSLYVKSTPVRSWSNIKNGTKRKVCHVFTHWKSGPHAKILASHSHVQRMVSPGVWFTRFLAKRCW